MKRLKLFFIIYCLLSPIPSVNAEKINVSFVSCCLHDDFFWPKVESFMKAAADDLDINLEVVYAEMNHIRMKEMAEKIATREKRPDYLIIDNYKLMAGEIIKSVNKSGVKIFLMANGLTEEQALEFGKPREKYANWIGELTPDNHYAGQQLAKALIDRSLAQGTKAKDSKLHMIALSGDYVTPAGLQRIDGLREEVSGYPDVDLKQIIPCFWQKKEARNRIEAILNRYPETSAIWAANDEMALGAMEGAVACGKKPGKDIFFGGVNWEKETLKKIADGSMVASVGGHFMMGGWALVLLHDYHKGRDFAEEGVKLKMKIFEIIDAQNVNVYLSQFEDENWHKIDFTRFSKILNPNVTKYDFSIKTLLQH